MSNHQMPKILVIEDETTQRILVKEYLEEKGYIVRLADDGQRGLKMAATTRPDLIILDLLLPTLDGCALCTCLKQNPATAHIPVILVTASRETDVIERGLAAGASDFVTKPVDWDFLADRVANVLRQSQDLVRLSAENEANEKALQSLLQSKDQLADQVELAKRESLAAAKERSLAAQREAENAIEAARIKADQQVRKIEAAAQEKIRSEQQKCRLEIERSVQNAKDVERSCWTLIEAISGSQMAKLNSLAHLTSATAKGCGTGNANEFATVINEADVIVQSLLSSTRNMELLSKHLTGSIKLNDSSVDLGSLITETIAKIRPASEHRRVSVVAVLPEPPIRIIADENRLRYVLSSIVMNALRHCPPQGTVRLEVDVDPQQSVQVKIVDNGVSIAPALVNNLRRCTSYPANVFNQQDSRVGFGIPMSTAIMNLHGGSLEIDSLVGEGTAITLSFPQERIFENGTRAQQANRSEHAVATDEFHAAIRNIAAARH